MGNVGSNVADLEVALATVRERIAKYQRQSIEPSTAVLLGPEDFDGQPRGSAEWASCSTKSAAASVTGPSQLSVNSWRGPSTSRAAASLQRLDRQARWPAPSGKIVLEQSAYAVIVTVPVASTLLSLGRV
jgi:hypothetical protein